MRMTVNKAHTDILFSDNSLEPIDNLLEALEIVYHETVLIPDEINGKDMITWLEESIEIVKQLRSEVWAKNAEMKKAYYNLK